MKKKKIFTYIEPGVSTPVQKLPIVSQLILLLRGFSDDTEAKAQEAIEEARLEVRATFIQFLDKALRPLRTGKAKKVTMRVSSDFDSVMEDVLEDIRYREYYRYEIHRPNNMEGIHHYSELVMEVLV